ncbi:MAG TPA: GyrI-like domain-containing protein [Solirubrobacteraceae bacterium]|jgi:effector-binding domain-containing protein
MSENQPHIEDRSAEPYVAIPVTVTMQTLAGAIDRGYPELFGWLASHGLTPAGPPFIRYLRIDMDAELDIELAVPVAGGAPADDRVHQAELPAGRYVVLLHVGPYDGLIDANATVQDWAEEHNIRWRRDHGSAWGGRVERYLTDPSAEPDSSRWETELAYLIDDR